MWDPNVSINFRRPLMMCDHCESSCIAFDSANQLWASTRSRWSLNFVLIVFVDSRGDVMVFIFYVFRWNSLLCVCGLECFGLPFCRWLHESQHCIRYRNNVFDSLSSCSSRHTKFGNFAEIIIFPFRHYRRLRSFARSWLHFAKLTTPRQ